MCLAKLSQIFQKPHTLRETECRSMTWTDETARSSQSGLMHESGVRGPRTLLHLIAVRASRMEKEMLWRTVGGKKYDRKKLEAASENGPVVLFWAWYLEFHRSVRLYR